MRAAKANTAAIRDTPTVTIVADPATVIETLAEAAGVQPPPIDPRTFTERSCETLLGHQITRQQLLAALLTGRMQVMFRTPGSRTVELGRTTRFANRAMVEAISILYRVCAGSGCDRPATDSEMDHIVEWGGGLGVTGVSNLRPLCPHDHDQRHRAGLTSDDQLDGYARWFARDGTPLEPGRPGRAAGPERVVGRAPP